MSSSFLDNEKTEASKITASVHDSFLLLRNNECNEDNYNNLRKAVKVKPVGYLGWGVSLTVLDLRCCKDLASEPEG